MSDLYKGYRDPALNILKEHGVQVWSDVELLTNHGCFSGIILPPY